MISKRGQVTIFIVVGILVLAMAMLFLYISSRTATQELDSQKISPDFDFVSSFVQGCLEKSVIGSIYKVSASGGYHQPPEGELLGLDIQGEYFQLPYYFKDAQSDLPELSIIESEIAAAAEDKLQECVAGFKSFEKQGYTITAGKPEIKIVLLQQTIATADFPIIIKKGDEETTLTTFTVTIPFNFVKKYDAVKEYLQLQETAADFFLGGDLSAKAAEQDALFTFAQVNSSKIAAELRYDEPLKKEPLIYRFGLQFDWEPSSEEMILTRKAAVEIATFPEWQITEPGIHTFQVKALGEGLTFEIEPDSLPINPQSGIITLDTASFPNDEYLYYVKASDEFENQAIAPLVINLNANDGSLPIIAPIEMQTAKAGEEFRYTVEVLDADNIIFTSQTYLFKIDEQSGEIVFTPSDEDKGLHSIRVDVKNEKGGTWQRWELEVQ